jgi:hypothetical protein
VLHVRDPEALWLSLEGAGELVVERIAGVPMQIASSRTSPDHLVVEGRPPRS